MTDGGNSEPRCLSPCAGGVIAAVQKAQHKMLPSQLDDLHSAVKGSFFHGFTSDQTQVTKLNNCIISQKIKKDKLFIIQILHKRRFLFPNHQYYSVFFIYNPTNLYLMCKYVTLFISRIVTFVKKAKLSPPLRYFYDLKCKSF